MTSAIEVSVFPFAAADSAVASLKGSVILTLASARALLVGMKPTFADPYGRAGSLCGRAGRRWARLDDERARINYTDKS